MDFFMKNIDELLENYIPGKPEFKPDVLKQIDEIKQKREKILQEKEKELQQKRVVSKTNVFEENKVNEMSMMINELLMENNQLRDKVKYLEDKISKLILQQIEDRKNKLKDKVNI